MKTQLISALGVLLIGVATGLWMLGYGKSTARSPSELRDGPGPAGPPGEIPAEGNFVPLLEEVQRMGYRLPSRSVSLDLSQELAGSRFEVQEETLDPEFCSRLGGYRGEPIVSWMCRTRFPPAMKDAPSAGSEAGSETGASRSGRYAVWHDGSREPLRQFDPRRNHIRLPAVGGETRQPPRCCGVSRRE